MKMNGSKRKLATKFYSKPNPTKRFVADYLPDELIIQILNNLTKYDELLAVKKVDCRFECLVADVIRSKVVLVSENRSPVHQMFHTNEWINISDNLISESTITFKLYPEMHQNIRKLIVSNLDLLSNSFNFENLVHLEITSTTNSKSNLNTLVLNLAELENLSIKDEKNKINFVLDCPKLKNLSIDFSINCLQKVIYPQSVETLKCLDNLLVYKFKNLKKLFCLNFDKVNEGEFTFAETLNKLINLEEFHFEEIVTADEDDPDLDEVRVFFDGLNLNNLIIYYKCINIQANPFTIDILEISTEEYYNNDESNLYESYLDLLSSNLTHTSLICRNLEAMSIDLIQKFTSLIELELHCNDFSEDKLITLLKVSKLNVIGLYKKLETKFLNLIVNYAGDSLVHLVLDEFDDLNFLIHFKYLETIELKQFFDLELFKKMIKTLDNLKSIKFELDDRTYYEIKIEDGYVQCFFGTELILKQSKNSFLLSINLINCWSQLFTFAHQI